MKKIIAVILIFSLFISGCAYNITKGDYEDNQKFYEKVNKVCEDKEELSIIINNNSRFKVKRLVMMNDTTSFINLRFNSIEKINTNDISQIEFKGTGASGIQGFLFGGLTGGLAANILSNPATGEGGYLGKVISISACILVGGLIGIIYSISNPGKTKISIKS